METISDIVREMRECANAADPSIWGDERIAGLVRNAKAEQLKYADRIEAAHKRETVTDCNALFTKPAENVNSEKVIYSNAKMREALEFAAHHLIAAMEDDELGGNILYLAGCMGVVAKKCRAALAEPRRNCDVGTAEEQHKRYVDFCCRHDCCDRCPLENAIDAPFGSDSKAICTLAWSQMPYEKGCAE